MPGIASIPGRGPKEANELMDNKDANRPTEATSQPVMPPGVFFYGKHEEGAAAGQAMAGQSSSSKVDAQPPVVPLEHRRLERPPRAFDGTETMTMCRLLGWRRKRL